MTFGRWAVGAKGTGIRLDGWSWIWVSFDKILADGAFWTGVGDGAYGEPGRGVTFGGFEYGRTVGLTWLTGGPRFDGTLGGALGLGRAFGKGRVGYGGTRNGTDVEGAFGLAGLDLFKGIELTAGAERIEGRYAAVGFGAFGNS